MSQPDQELTPAQAFFRRRRWARFLMYTIALLLQLTLGVLVDIVWVSLCEAGAAFRAQCGEWWRVTRYGLRLYRADLESWDKEGDKNAPD